MTDTEASDEKAPAKAPKVKTVAMTRDAEQHPAPHTADVHPDEVANWKAAGWREAE